MAIITKVRRVVNPARKRRTRNRSASGRRKMTAKQIKHFGTKRQKAALKAARTRKRTATAKPRRIARRKARRTRNASTSSTSAPKRVVVVVKNPTRRKARRKRSVTRRSNPLLVTLGAINPQPKRKKVMAKRRRKSVATRPRRRRANPTRRRRATRVVVVTKRRSARRKANPTRRRRSTSGRRRNPAIFGSSHSAVETFKMVGGGLVGVTLAKTLPAMLPAQLVSTPILRVAMTLAAAYLGQFIAGKVASGKFADAVFFGGLMQAGSQALNTFLPSVGARFGLGELIAGNFVVPQNPIRSANMLPPAPPAKGTMPSMNGVARAYGSAY